MASIMWFIWSLTKVRIGLVINQCWHEYVHTPYELKIMSHHNYLMSYRNIFYRIAPYHVM